LLNKAGVGLCDHAQSEKWQLCSEDNGILVGKKQPAPPWAAGSALKKKARIITRFTSLAIRTISVISLRGGPDGPAKGVVFADWRQPRRREAKLVADLQFLC
jgi:hypothetical protein